MFYDNASNDTRESHDYTDAPATHLLATHCCLCGRPLVDAPSVERGVGPTCARNAGLGDEHGEPSWDLAAELLAVTDVSPSTVPGWGVDARRAVNALVHRVGVNVDAERVPYLAVAIAHLGFVRLGQLVAERCAAFAVMVSREGEELTVRTSKLSETHFRAWLDATLAIPGRVWHRETRTTTFPLTSREALWEALHRLPAGTAIVGTSVTVLLP